MLTNEEWADLSPESRHRLNVYVQNAEMLAELVKAYVTVDGTRPTTPGQVIARMLELAAKLAPGEIVGGSGVWRDGFFVPDETPNKATLDIIAAMQRGPSDAPCVTPRAEIHSTPQQTERIIDALRAPSVEGVVVDGRYVETPLSNLPPGAYEILGGVEHPDEGSLHVKRVDDEKDTATDN